MILDLRWKHQGSNVDQQRDFEPFEVARKLELNLQIYKTAWEDSTLGTVSGSLLGLKP